MNAYEQIRYALTEAKGWLIECLNKEYPPTEDSINHAIDQIDVALSKPPRNCDVGTPEEQCERLDLFCHANSEDESERFPCGECPYGGIARCDLYWAQMPYEEGGVQ